MNFFFLLLLFVAPAWAADIFDGFEAANKIEQGFQGGIYIVPNEPQFYEFDPVLKNKTGAIISVGTFRALESASRGNFSHLIMADMDGAIVAFNQMQLEALKASSTREQFAANLLGDPTLVGRYSLLDHKDFQSIMAEHMARRSSILQREREIEKILQIPGFVSPENQKRLAELSGSPELVKRVTKQMNALIPDTLIGGFGDPKVDAGRELLKSLDDEQYQVQKRFDYWKAITELSQTSHGDNAGFLADEARFQKLRTMAQRGDIHVVRTDLTGTSLEEMGKRLRANNINVSVLDASNAPDYFLKGDKIKETATAYAKNLLGLPLTPDARINFTSSTNAGLEWNGNGSWTYFSWPANDYIAEVKKLDQSEEYTSLLQMEAKEHVLNPGPGSRGSLRFLKDIPPQPGTGDYIVPNEQEFHLFDSSLKGKKDALISVGTFRSLEAASRGDFSELIMLDIDQGVVDFNKLQIQALKISPNGDRFIANMLGDRSLTPAEIRTIRKNPAAREAKIKSLLEQFKTRPRFNDKEYRFFKKRMEYVKTILNYSAHSEDLPFIDDPKRYDKLHRMAKFGEINSVHADLAGSRLKEIGDTLKAYGRKISVVDLSNAPDYFLPTDPKEKLDRTVTDAFRKNLANLPLTPDARVNFTTMDNLAEAPWAHTRDWRYFSWPAADYQKLVDLSARTGDYYGSLAKYGKPHFLNATGNAESCDITFSHFIPEP